MTHVEQDLAKQLLRLCEEHDLTNLSVDISRRADGTFYFGSFAHAGGVCAHAISARETPQAAIGEAITALKARLGLSLIDVPELVAAA